MSAIIQIHHQVGFIIWHNWPRADFYVWCIIFLKEDEEKM